LVVAPPSWRRGKAGRTHHCPYIKRSGELATSLQNPSRPSPFLLSAAALAYAKTEYFTTIPCAARSNLIYLTSPFLDQEGGDAIKLYMCTFQRQEAVLVAVLIGLDHMEYNFINHVLNVST
jgi:hypothetical protein